MKRIKTLSKEAREDLKYTIKCAKKSKRKIWFQCKKVSCINCPQNTDYALCCTTKTYYEWIAWSKEEV